MIRDLNDYSLSSYDTECGVAGLEGWDFIERYLVSHSGEVLCEEPRYEAMPTRRGRRITVGHYSTSTLLATQAAGEAGIFSDWVSGSNHSGSDKLQEMVRTLYVNEPCPQYPGYRDLFRPSTGLEGRRGNALLVEGLFLQKEHQSPELIQGILDAIVLRFGSNVPLVAVNLSPSFGSAFGPYPNTLVELDKDWAKQFLHFEPFGSGSYLIRWTRK